jgi:phosphoenolpyruvate synthase/pyruvate phosphate dikinase
VNILNNEVYLGKIRWGKEPVKRVIKDGMVTKKRIQNDNYELYEGRHEAIITQEQWDLVKAAQKKRGHHSTHITKELQNPFVGILYCDKCGAKLKRNVPGKNQGTTPWFRCPTRHCDCRTTKCHIVEEAIRNAMDDWLDEYIIQLSKEEKPTVDPIAEALDTVQAQLGALQHQQETICEYLEKGIYTIDMFTKRNTALSREIKNLQEAEADLLRKKEAGAEANQAAIDIIPTAQHILDNYDILTTEEKNRLWKLVLKKATLYRTPAGELSVHIYPKLPK